MPGSGMDNRFSGELNQDFFLVGERPLWVENSHVFIRPKADIRLMGFILYPIYKVRRGPSASCQEPVEPKVNVTPNMKILSVISSEGWSSGPDVWRSKSFNVVKGKGKNASACLYSP